MEFLDYGIALGIALLARRELQEFRQMFQSTLDTLTANDAKHDARFDASEARMDRLESAVSKTNESVAGLAMVVSAAIEFEGEEEVAEENLQGRKPDAPN